MRIEIITEVEVQVHDWFGFRTRTYIQLVNGDWVGDGGERVGPERANRFSLLTQRAIVVMAQAQMRKEKGEDAHTSIS